MRDRKTSTRFVEVPMTERSRFNSDSSEKAAHMSTDVLGAGGNLLSMMPYIRWGISHATEFPAILQGAKDVYDAKGLEPRWGKIKENGDRVVICLKDFPGIEAIAGGGDSPTPAPTPGPVTPHGDDVFSALPASFAAKVAADHTELCAVFAATPENLLAAAIHEEAENMGKLGDGSIVRFLVENLPTIISAVMQIVSLFK